ncbi:type IV pilus modification protein PilV [Endozoicomonas sp. OPT23]|uniref:type IV pilus modification protein PilV n=1 Tax=Endozoicomonas sp. OPT23 TaxID=2072845 RepID=UPI00129A4632|nr:type IV pilus modification protein PilV [Endozoicomonas sp. OPT23]MRI33718.1 type IV pilus modification protein PilV [Endozoicomonas sp. OPT23]
MTGCKLKKRRGKQGGVGLLEVLVTLVVVSVGALGMVGLQSKSIQHNQTSYLRSQAAFLANDMMERIRSNRKHASTSTEYSVLINEHEATACDNDQYPDQCETGACTRSELAEYDIKQWKFNLGCQLPEGQGSILETTESTGKVFAITIQFNDSRGRKNNRTVSLRGSL